MSMRLPTVRIKNDKTGEIRKLNRDDWMEAMAYGAYRNYTLVSDQTRVNKDETLEVRTPDPDSEFAKKPAPVPEVEAPPIEEKKQPEFNIGSMDHQEIVAAASEYFDVTLDVNKHLLTLRKEFGELLK